MIYPGGMPRYTAMPPPIPGPMSAFSRMIDRLSRRMLSHAAIPPPPLDPQEWNRINDQRAGAQNRTFRAMHLDRRSAETVEEVRSRLKAETGNYLEGVVFGPTEEHNSTQRTR